MLTVAVLKAARRQSVVGFDEGVIDIEALGQFVDEELFLPTLSQENCPVFSRNGSIMSWIQNLRKQIVVIDAPAAIRLLQARVQRTVRKAEAQ